MVTEHWPRPEAQTRAETYKDSTARHLRDRGHHCRPRSGHRAGGQWLHGRTPPRWAERRGLSRDGTRSSHLPRSPAHRGSAGGRVLQPHGPSRRYREGQDGRRHGVFRQTPTATDCTSGARYKANESMPEPTNSSLRGRAQHLGVNVR